MRITKETAGDKEEVDSEGNNKDTSNDNMPPHEKLKTAKKILRSITSKSQTRKKREELLKKRKANCSKMKQASIAHR